MPRRMYWNITRAYTTADHNLEQFKDSKLAGVPNTTDEN